MSAGLPDNAFTASASDDLLNNIARRDSQSRSTASAGAVRVHVPASSESPLDALVTTAPAPAPYYLLPVTTLSSRLPYSFLSILTTTDLLSCEQPGTALAASPFATAATDAPSAAPQSSSVEVKQRSPPAHTALSAFGWTDANSEPFPSANSALSPARAPVLLPPLTSPSSSPATGASTAPLQPAASAVPSLAPAPAAAHSQAHAHAPPAPRPKQLYSEFSLGTSQMRAVLYKNWLIKRRNPCQVSARLSLSARMYCVVSLNHFAFVVWWHTVVLRVFDASAYDAAFGARLSAVAA